MDESQKYRVRLDSEEGPSYCLDKDPAKSALTQEWPPTSTSPLQKFGADGNVSDSKAKEAPYRVHLDSVLDCQMDDYDHNVDYETFQEAKTYALDAFEIVIERLTYLCEQMKAAEKFDELDLGWWEPLIERLGGSPEVETEEVSDDE
jgi:hypothetical protein